MIRTRILMPVPDSEWRTPSQGQPKNQFGHEPREVRFRVTARLHDGFVVWRGYFDNRGDFDEFLWAIATGNLRYDRYVQRLPTPWWPGLDPDVVYQFATLRFLTSLSASNQTDTVPSDWNNTNNTIDVIASGGSGGSAGPGSGSYTGGSGAAWSRSNNITLTPGGSATFFQNAGGAAIVRSSAPGVGGAAGNDAWYNGTTLAGSSVGAKGGLAGGVSTGTPAFKAGSAGGAAASGVGTVNKTSGGASGAANTTSSDSCSGGGGAGGPNGNGVASADTAADGVTAGGAGDNSSGGSGGATGNNPGGNGTEFDATHGSGGGGGANHGSVSNIIAGGGGSYGAGGGAAATGPGFTSTSGAGAPPLIFQSYVPDAGGFNLAMLGF